MKVESANLNNKSREIVGPKIREIIDNSLPRQQQISRMSNTGFRYAQTQYNEERPLTGDTSLAQHMTIPCRLSTSGASLFQAGIQRNIDSTQPGKEQQSTPTIPDPARKAETSTSYRSPNASMFHSSPQRANSMMAQTQERLLRSKSELVTFALGGKLDSRMQTEHFRSFNTTDSALFSGSLAKEIITTVPTRSIVTLQGSHGSNNLVRSSTTGLSQHSTPIVTSHPQSLMYPTLTATAKSGSNNRILYSSNLSDLKSTSSLINAKPRDSHQITNTEVLTITHKPAQPPILVPGTPSVACDSSLASNSIRTSCSKDLSNVESKLLPFRSSKIAPLNLENAKRVPATIQSTRLYNERKSNYVMLSSIPSGSVASGLYPSGERPFLKESTTKSPISFTSNYIYLDHTQAACLHDFLTSLLIAFDKHQHIAEKYLEFFKSKKDLQSALMDLVSNGLDNKTTKASTSSKSGDVIASGFDKSSATKDAASVSISSSIKSDHDVAGTVEPNNEKEESKKQQDLSDLISLFEFFAKDQTKLDTLSATLSRLNSGLDSRSQRNKTLHSLIDMNQTPGPSASKAKDERTKIKTAQSSDKVSADVATMIPHRRTSIAQTSGTEQIRNPAEISTKSSLPSREKPSHQEYLYSLQIDTKNNGNGKARCVDVISICKTLPVLLMTEFLTPPECDKIKQTVLSNEESVVQLNSKSGVDYILKVLRRRLAAILRVNAEDIHDFTILKRKPTHAVFEQSLEYDKANVLIFLDDATTDGALELNSLGLHISPCLGAAVVWINSQQDKQALISKLLPPSTAATVVLCEVNRCTRITCEPQKNGNQYSTTSPTFKNLERESQNFIQSRDQSVFENGKVSKLQTVFEGDEIESK